jgi:DNA (cytosine-5)-methyltransferase 1
MPTLNAFDNGDIRTTVIIVMRQREGKPGGGKGPMLGEKSFTLATNNDQTLFIVPIQDGKEMEKNQNGIGIGVEGDPSYTLDKTGSQSVAMESIVRRLTPLECERLQGFPDDWTVTQSDSQRYKQMGNAVAVPVVEWVIQNICDIV